MQVTGGSFKRLPNTATSSTNRDDDASSSAGMAIFGTNNSFSRINVDRMGSTGELDMPSHTNTTTSATLPADDAPPQDAFLPLPPARRNPTMILLNSSVDIQPQRRAAKRDALARPPRPAPAPRGSKPQTTPQRPEGALLDGFALVEAGGVDLPENVETLNLMGRGFADVEVEDLHHFRALQELDVGDNRLPGMHCLEALPALRTLKMQCNDLASLFINKDSFQLLHTLELSYNKLAASALESLAQLPALRELDLSFNCVSSIPLGALMKPNAFQALETLHLGGQTPKLSSGSVFRLAHLPNLRTLRVPSNKISSFDPAKMPEANAFPSLGLLDLSSNNIEMEDGITCFLSCPILDMVVLWGNPLARLAPRDVGPEVPFLGSNQAYLLLRKPEPPSKPRLHTLYADPVVLDQDQTQGMPFHPDEMLKTFQGVERGVDDVRDRLANAASGAPEEEDPANDETFFITGGGQELGGQEQVDEEEGMLPDEMQLLAEENARVEYVPGGPRRHQPSAALAALKFALSHPLVEGDGGPAPHHLKTTASTKAKVNLKPIEKPKDAAKKQDPKAQQIQTIENILSTMKDRLQKVEANLRQTANVQAAPSEVPMKGATFK